MKTLWKSIKEHANSLLISVLKPFVIQIIKYEYLVWGDPKRLKVHPTANVVNTLFNTSSGKIEVGEYAFMGHDVLLLAGTHDYTRTLVNRQRAVPESGYDIVVGRGVWIGSRAILLGPCQVGDHAVIAAGSVVSPGTIIPDYSTAAGCPAKIIKKLNHE